MIKINIDSDNEGKLKLAVQGHVIPDWVYENSQVEHEHQRVRQVQLHQQMLEREAEAQRDRRRKKERLRKQQRQNQRTNEKTQINYSSPIKNKQKDDELEF